MAVVALTLNTDYVERGKGQWNPQADLVLYVKYPLDVVTKHQFTNIESRDSGSQSGVLHGLPQCSESLSFMPLRVSCHSFWLPTIELNLLTFLPFLFFPALSLPAEGKQEALQVVPLVIWAYFVVYFLLFSEYCVYVYVCMICASEHWFV